MLEVLNVSLGYGSNVVVRDVSLQLHPGEIGCLLGPSGCGKTTLLRAIAGFEPVRAGRIALQGVDMATPERAVAPQRRDVGMVFQDHALFPHLNVAGNVGFGLRNLSTSAKAERVQDMLDLVGLQGLGGRWPHELSGGQQQRVALARALAPQPGLLLMDEPFSSLDTSMRESIAREVRTILKQAKATALMVTHDQNEAFAMADNIGVMSHGQLQQWGSAVKVYGAPASREVAEFVGEGSWLSAQALPGGDLQTALGVLPASHPHFTMQEGVHVLLRPEHVQLSAQGTPAKVVARTFRGSHFVLALELSHGERLLAQTALHHAPTDAASVYVSLATPRLG